jgi:hypothetical protein
VGLGVAAGVVTDVGLPPVVLQAAKNKNRKPVIRVRKKGRCKDFHILACTSSSADFVPLD